MTFILTLLIASIASNAAIPRFSEVSPGIYRGGQPTESRDYDDLRERGIRTIINLRTDHDRLERKKSKKLGMKLIEIGIHPLVPVSEKDMNQVLRDLANPNLRPIFIHCREGKDRTGLAIGLYRVRYEGWTQQRAYLEMLSFGFSEYLFFLKNYFWQN